MGVSLLIKRPMLWTFRSTAIVRFVAILFRHSKVCPICLRDFCSGNVFTCSHVATQRGESVNTLKEKGNKKTELRSFNLLLITEHVLNQFDRFQVRPLNRICDLIRKKKHWREYVDNIWMESFKNSTKF